MATKSIQRSLKLIKEYRWLYWIVEHWNGYTRRREDLFNCIDILCLDDKRSIGIQAMGSDIASHRRKVLENPFVIPWLTAGNELQFWAFRKLKKKRGMKATYWDCKKIDVLIVKGEIYFEERK